MFNNPLKLPKPSFSLPKPPPAPFDPSKLDAGALNSTFKVDPAAVTRSVNRANAQAANAITLDADKTKTEGLTGVRAQANPLSISGEGTQEQLYNSHGGDLMTPSESEKALPGIKTELAKPGNSQTYLDESKPKLDANKNAQDAFDVAMGAVNQGPQTSNYQEQGIQGFDMEAPDLDVYYDRQAKKTQDRLNRSFAARGMYGSSEATNNISDAMQGLGAEQANREADYNLARLAEKRGWATGADNQSLGTEGLRSDGLKNLTTAGIGADRSLVDSIMAGGDLAADADKNAIDELMLGIKATDIADSKKSERINDSFDIAGDVQDAREGRVDTAFGIATDIPKYLSNTVNDSLGGAIDKDSEALATEIELKLGIPREELNQIMQQQGIDLQDEAAKRAFQTTMLQTGGAFLSGGATAAVPGLAPGTGKGAPPTTGGKGGVVSPTSTPTNKPTSTGGASRGR